MRSAFDTVAHGAILQALDGTGVVDRLGGYIRAFLHDPTLQVKVGRVTSSPQDARYGVLQGSVLRSFLFNLVLPPLHDYIPTGLRHSVEAVVYADDMTLWTPDPTAGCHTVKACIHEALGAVSLLRESWVAVLGGKRRPLCCTQEDSGLDGQHRQSHSTDGLFS